MPAESAEPAAQVQFFGQYLVARGLITREALLDALAYQEAVNIPLGALALSKGLLSEKQLLHIHTEQRRTDLKFGEIAVKKGFLSRPQLDLLLSEQKQSRVFLGEALRQQGHLSRELLDSSLAEYQASQKVAEAKVLMDLSSLEEPLLVNSAVRLSTRMLLRMGGQVAKVAGVDSETRLSGQEYLFWMEVEGEYPFVYGISLEAEELLLMARAMLVSVGEEDEELPEEVDLLVLDVGREFVNVVVGHICTRLSHEGYKTMPLPPDLMEQPEPGFEIPRAWDGPTRTVNVRLVLPRGQLVISVLTPRSE